MDGSQYASTAQATVDAESVKAAEKLVAELNKEMYDMEHGPEAGVHLTQQPMETEMSNQRPTRIEQTNFGEMCTYQALSEHEQAPMPSHHYPAESSTYPDTPAVMMPVVVPASSQLHMVEKSENSNNQIMENVGNTANLNLQTQAVTKSEMVADFNQSSIETQQVAQIFAEVDKSYKPTEQSHEETKSVLEPEFQNSDSVETKDSQQEVSTHILQTEISKPPSAEQFWETVDENSTKSDDVKEVPKDEPKLNKKKTVQIEVYIAAMPATYKDEMHPNRLLSKLKTQRDNGQGCDVVFLLGEQSVLAHCCIVSANSPYLASKIAAAQQNFSSDKLQIPLPEEVNLCVFEHVIDYMYSGCLTVSEDTVSEMCDLSELLLMPSLKTCCSSFLLYPSTSSQCLQALNIAVTKDVKDVQSVLLKCVAKYTEILSNCHKDVLQSLDIKTLKSILLAANWGDRISATACVAFASSWMDLQETLGEEQVALLGAISCEQLSEDILSRVEYSQLKSRLQHSEQYSTFMERFAKKQAQEMPQGDELMDLGVTVESQEDSPVFVCTSDQPAKLLYLDPNYNHVKKPAGKKRGRPRKNEPRHLDPKRKQETEEIEEVEMFYALDDEVEEEKITDEEDPDFDPEWALNEVYVDTGNTKLRKSKRKPMRPKKVTQLFKSSAKGKKASARNISKAAPKAAKKRGRKSKNGIPATINKSAIVNKLSVLQTKAEENPAVVNVKVENSEEAAEDLEQETSDPHVSPPVVKKRRGRPPGKRNQVHEQQGDGGEELPPIQTAFLQCPRCPRTFPTVAQLRAHMKGHGSDIPYLCEICGFVTKHIGSIHVHRKTHDPSRKLKCPYEECQFLTPRRSRLDDHINTDHRGIKNHVCSFCGKPFGSRKHMARHEKTHSDSRPFQCDLCPYNSTRNDKLRYHFKKRHPDIAILRGYVTAEGLVKFQAQVKLDNTRKKKNTKPKIKKDKPASGNKSEMKRETKAVKAKITNEAAVSTVTLTALMQEEPARYEMMVRENTEPKVLNNPAEVKPSPGVFLSPPPAHIHYTAEGGYFPNIVADPTGMTGVPTLVAVPQVSLAQTGTPTTLQSLTTTHPDLGGTSCADVVASAHLLYSYGMQ